MEERSDEAIPSNYEISALLTVISMTFRVGGGIHPPRIIPGLINQAPTFK